MPYHYLRLENQGPVALLTLDSPATANAMDEDLGPELARGTRLVPGFVAVDLVRVCRDTGAEIGVLCTPPDKTQEIANRFLEVPVKAILNFAPVQIQVPEGFKVENVDFTVKLDNLAYHLTAG